MAYFQFHNESYEEQPTLQPELQNRQYFLQRQNRKWKSCCRLTFGVAFLVCVVIITILCFLESRHGKKTTSKTDFVVDTKSGKVQGTTVDGVHVFKGIPYATVKHRWMLPKSIRPWNDILYANNFGPKCLQLTQNGHSDGLSDCLRLNIWSPVTTEKLLPVIVFIHDGGLMKGSGHEAGEIPTLYSVRETKVVYVTLNYRLGAHGWLALEAISSSIQGHLKGNYGLLDQVAALTWIKEHIASFGGNSSEVTLAGMGSGATCALALATSSKTKGLFNKLWLMSPAPRKPTPLLQAQAANLKFLLATNCLLGNSTLAAQLHTIRCLHLLKDRHLMQAYDVMQQQYASRSDYMPTSSENHLSMIVEDGDLITNNFHFHKHMEILLGMTLDSVSNPENAPQTWSQWKSKRILDLRPLERTSGRSQFIYRHYKSISENSPSRAYRQMIYDLRMLCPLQKFVSSSREHVTFYRYIVHNGMSSASYTNQLFFGRDDKTSHMLRDIVMKFINNRFSESSKHQSNIFNIGATNVTIEKRLEVCNKWNSLHNSKTTHFSNVN